MEKKKIVRGEWGYLYCLVEEGKKVGLGFQGHCTSIFSHSDIYLATFSSLFSFFYRYLIFSISISLHFFSFFFF